MASLSEEQMIAIDKVANNKTYSLQVNAYRFGKGNTRILNSLEAAAKVCSLCIIPPELGFEAVGYLNEQIKVTTAVREARDFNKPTQESWKDGDNFPEFASPIEIARLLFGQIGVSTSGTLRFKGTVPKWLYHVNRSLTPSHRVKEYDIMAGLAEEMRRFRRGLSESEKEARHTVTAAEVLSMRGSVVAETKDATRLKYIEMLKYTDEISGDGKREVMRFLKLYSAPTTSEDKTITNMRQLHATMIFHWIWLVKRRLNKLPTKYEICLVFLGAQGVGKSYVARRIKDVLPDLSTDTEVAAIVDERETPRWENYYIAFLDEISKESRDSLAKLKGWITSTDAEFRPMRTNDSEECDKNAQALGTSNFPLTTILKDTSGMRRFWEVPSNQERSKTFEGMDTIDWELIYRSVDEDNSNGYYGKDLMFYDNIVEVQEASRDKSVVEEFLHDRYMINEKGQIEQTVETLTFSVHDLLKEYNEWCADHRWGSTRATTFRDALRALSLTVRPGASNKLCVSLNDPVKLKTFLAKTGRDTSLEDVMVTASQLEDMKYDVESAGEPDAEPELISNKPNMETV